MATPQELYEETKTRLELNVAKAQMLQKEIDQKISEKNKLMQPIIEDQGAIKVLSNTDGVITAQAVESN